MDKPLYSIVIPARNEEKYISECLGSISKLDWPSDQLEVILVDGMSTDRTLELARSWQDKIGTLHILTNEQKVTPVSLNLGIKRSSGDVVIILGAHAELYSDYISECQKAFERSGADCVGGVLDNIYETKTSESIGMAMSSRFGVGNAHFRTGNYEGFVDTVAFGAYKKEVFEEVGLFDEALVRNQDDEFNYRLTRSKKKIWLSRRIGAKYYVRGSFKKLWKQYYQYGYWKVFVNKKHNSLTTIRQLVPLLLVLYSMALLVSWIQPILFYMSSIPFIAYLLLGAINAIKHGRGISGKLGTWISYFILHYSYGLGYLVGILNFYVLSKKPSERSKELSR